MKNIDKSINKLKGIINDPYCRRMNFSTVKGYLGELIVIKKLEGENASIVHKGNQSGYDLEIEDGQIKIDVKFSTLKSEFKGCPSNWGWALKHKNKKKEITCTHFVCIAVGDNYDPIKLFVIKKEHLNKFPKSSLPQFKNVERGFVIIPDNTKTDLTNKILKEYFDKCNNLVTNGIVKELRMTDTLLDKLKK